MNLTSPCTPLPLNNPNEALPPRWFPEVHEAVKKQVLRKPMTAQCAVSICSAGIAYTGSSAGIAYMSLPQQAQHV